MRQEEMHDRQIRSAGLRGYDNTRNNSESDDGTNHKNADLRSALKNAKSASTGDLANTVRFGPPREITVPAETSTPSKFAWMWEMTKRSGSFATVSESSSIHSAKSRLTSKSDLSSNIDDCSKCSECLKRFRVGKRYKHHCSRCMATFCHKHGRTTHSNFTSCKVPGDCVCNICLALEQKG